MVKDFQRFFCFTLQYDNTWQEIYPSKMYSRSAEAGKQHNLSNRYTTPLVSVAVGTVTIILKKINYVF